MQWQQIKINSKGAENNSTFIGPTSPLLPSTFCTAQIHYKYCSSLNMLFCLASFAT